MALTNEQQAELRKSFGNYRTVGAFVSARPKLSYVQFDYSVSHGLTLFMIEPDFDLETLENKIDEILKTLPAIKRIFAQPSIHLKEQDVILPTESVRIINNKTIRHISSHTELWSDIKEGEVVPSRLLTRTYEDNYGIYENLVFCQTVDDILAFTRTSSRFLRELIYTNRTIEINLLERVNHLNYFLALGKLHIGYSRNFEAYYAASLRYLNKLQFIESSVVPRLKRPVYKNNRVRPAQIKLHKTNILSMHKEYHQIYKLAKYFALRDEKAENETTDKELSDLQKNYFDFCQALCVFSIGHFNFACNENKLLDFSRLNMTFKFKQWKATIKKITFRKRRLLSLTVQKDVEYKVIIIPSVCADNIELLEEIKANLAADEYAVFTPFDDDESNAMLVDITSIQSFRRIQQILLRSMIYSDNKREDCPFCGNKLTYNSANSSEDDFLYECIACRTEIYDKTCHTTGKRYSCTRIAGLTKNYGENDGDWLAKRKRETQMFFRNITELNDDMEVVCPVCNGVHH